MPPKPNLPKPVADSPAPSGAPPVEESEDATEDLTESSGAPVVVKYVGLSHFREIDANSWKSVDVEGQKKVRWDRDSEAAGGQAVVSARAAEYLTKVAGDKEDFKVVDPDDYSFSVKGELGIE